MYGYNANSTAQAPIVRLMMESFVRGDIFGYVVGRPEVAPPLRRPLLPSQQVFTYNCWRPFPQVISVAFIYVANTWIVGDTDRMWGFTWTCGLTAEVNSAKQPGFWGERQGRIFGQRALPWPGPIR